ncbi:L-type lectin-domain containing receptor kinase IX.1-like [Oryza brachyantha]|uniref:non-specific serine/threonine protein kinase n=1 Tax=Oryza brachyantha TaxID=4533 RepID=A0A0U1WXP3_ORYBR|nr:L-type lectin-domain containing receptor kinase IX.1-like [Oryza brachyantha]AHW98493.1 protein kinase [Oryza brachyantha]
MASSQLLVFFLLVACCSLHCSRAAATTNNPPPAPAPPFSFNFDFSNTYTYRLEDLSFAGNAAVHGTIVDLTCNVPQCTTGRMSYGRPVPLWDRATSEVASFATEFAFKIVTPNDKARGNGMAFFLAGYPSRVPPNPSGRNFGLIDGDGDDAGSGPDRFIAVEFDTYDDSFERPKPIGDHIGIDVSSVANSINRTSLNFSRSGAMKALIKFDNTTRMLVASVEFTEAAAGSSRSAAVQVSAKLGDPRALLPPEVAVGFSAANGATFQLNQILSWSFNSTLSAPHPPFKGHHKKKGMAAMSPIIGALIFVLLLLWVILSWWKWRSSSRDIATRTGGVRQFKYTELAAATNHFSSENRLIGAGAFGEVYKGFFKELGREVAVKKISPESRSEAGSKDLFAEVKTISRAKHKNLVELVGWCMNRRWSIVDFMCWCSHNAQKNSIVFLVYEFVDNGNLRVHLHEKETVLPWTMRYKIVKDICSALVYLHHERHPFVLHRNIKPNNVLLDKEFNAKLADFGLSRTTTDSAGKASYLDPECRRTGKFKRSSDVYSLGLLLLEITCKKDENSYAKVWNRYMENSLMQLADDRLQGLFDERQMERVIVLGLWCCQLNINVRPTVQQAMDFLENDGPLPELAKQEASSSKIGNQE